MKPLTPMLLVGLLAGGPGGASASAMPRLDGSAAAPVAAPAVEPVRLVCNYRHCYRVGGYYRPYRYYRPYGYYRPYYYGPHLGIGLGGVGIGIY